MPLVFNIATTLSQVVKENSCIEESHTPIRVSKKSEIIAQKTLIFCESQKNFKGNLCS